MTNEEERPQGPPRQKLDKRVFNWPYYLIWPGAGLEWHGIN